MRTSFNCEADTTYCCLRGLLHPRWMSMWHVRQTTRVQRIRAAMICTQLGLCRRPFTFQIAKCADAVDFHLHLGLAHFAFFR